MISARSTASSRKPSDHDHQQLGIAAQDGCSTRCLHGRWSSTSPKGALQKFELPPRSPQGLKRATTARRPCFYQRGRPAQIQSRPTQSRPHRIKPAGHVNGLTPHQSAGVSAGGQAGSANPPPAASHPGIPRTSASRTTQTASCCSFRLLPIPFHSPNRPAAHVLLRGGRSLTAHMRACLTAAGGDALSTHFPSRGFKKPRTKRSQRSPHFNARIAASVALASLRLRLACQK